MMSAKRLARIAIILKPATLLKFHKALVNRKYRLLFSNKLPKKLSSSKQLYKLSNKLLADEVKDPMTKQITLRQFMNNSFFSGINFQKRAQKLGLLPRL